MRRALVLAMLLGGAASRARADDKPWVTGVSDEQKAAAHALLDAGNARFVEHDYLGALDKFKEALTHWDHPAIRFNMVRCLIQLGRALEASENLELSLKYGAAPLEEAVYTEALAYQKLLAGQVGTLHVDCKQPHVSVSLDGAPLTTCPGDVSRRVQPGRHQLVGSGPGLLTKSVDVVVIGGSEERASVTLAPFERGGKIVHRWSTWVPWLVVAGGLTVTGVGALIEYQSYQTMDAYDHALVAACFDTGCDASHPLSPSIAAQKDRAITQNHVAIGVISAGLATVVAGGVLLYLNRGRTVYPAAEHIDVAPTRGGATASLRLAF